MRKRKTILILTLALLITGSFGYRLHSRRSNIRASKAQASESVTGQPMKKGMSDLESTNAASQVQIRLAAEPTARYKMAGLQISNKNKNSMAIKTDKNRITEMPITQLPLSRESK